MEKRGKIPKNVDIASETVDKPVETVENSKNIVQTVKKHEIDKKISKSC